MIVVCRAGLGAAQVEEIREAIARRGLDTVESHADGRTLLTARTDPGALEDLAIGRLPGVEAILATSSPHPRVDARPDGSRAIVRAREAVFGDDTFAVVAGPCAVEDRDQILASAETVSAAGGSALRGGAYKPRTSPYSFQGLGEKGLALLAEVRERTGLPIVTEVLDPRDVERVGAVADVFQVGSRNMTNTPLLREVADRGLPVLLKRGMSATFREFLLAAETLLDAGAEDVVLCERGIRSFDTVMRNLLDLGTVVALRRATHLPVLVDPSHGTGRADLVPALSRAAAAAGADGLLVEVHPHPELARSDGNQALRPEELEPLVRSCRAIAEIVREEIP